MDFKIIHIFLALSFLYSCNGYFEPESMIELTKNQATKDYDYSKYRVASIYSDVQSGFSVIGNAMLASACDEAEHAIENSSIQNFNRGTWNKFSNPDAAWDHYYRAISKANTYLNFS